MPQRKGLLPPQKPAAAPKPAARPAKPRREARAAAPKKKTGHVVAPDALPRHTEHGEVLAEQAAWSEGDTVSHHARELARIPPELVQLHTDPAELPAQPVSSRGLFELASPTAQRAFALGLLAREASFHVFVAAEPQVMIEADLVRFAARYLEGQSAPPDIVYVHDFDRPEAPRSYSIPAGEGPRFAAAMDDLVDGLMTQIPAIQDLDAIKQAQNKLSNEFERHNRELVSGLETRAKTLGFGIRTIQGGVQTFPILHGKPVSAEQFGVLDETTKRALAEAEQKLTDEVSKAAELVQHAGARFQAARIAAHEDAAHALVASGLAVLRKELGALVPLLEPYLEQVQRALLIDWDDFLEDLEPQAKGDSEPDNEGREDDPEHAQRLVRFRVNVLTSSDKGATPPILHETNPTYPNLFGYLERRARFGALLTDFTRIRAGSLHRASGGILLVRASDLMTDPIIWERLKRVMREQKLGAEDPLGPLGLYATTLRPQPVPIRVRVILVGPPELYNMLLDADPDFASLFRVKVEIVPSVPRTPESLRALDGFLMSRAAERGWGEFEPGARARLLDYASRLAGERDRLSLMVGPLEETAAFASTLEAPDPNKLGNEQPPDEELPRSRAEGTRITARDVELAWRERRERTGAAERHFRDLLVRGEIALDTGGFRIGVVNGLSVLSTGDVDFGQPTRITAVVSLGREGVMDVEREAQLSGAIHTKGMAILRGYLGRMFGQERPLSLRAQIAFEQSYGEIDGDSASSTELYALFSALADVGIDQSLAVTGSMNQLGAVQAVGGVSAKIEGFFDLCATRGLTGCQGVVMPRTNLNQLVLRDDVSRAIEAGRFHLYAIDNVAQGIEILTGLPAGDRDQSGRFPARSVFGRVERRIIEIAERLREAEASIERRGVPVARDSVDDLSTADLVEVEARRSRGSL